MFLAYFVFGIEQADVEVSFKVKELEKADVIEPSWTDPQKICSQGDLSVMSGLGPFGLMVLASNDMEEYTSVYFRIFKSNDDTNKKTKYVVLMCSDQSRYIYLLSTKSSKRYV